MRTPTEGLASAGRWAARNSRRWLAIEAQFLSRAQHVFVMGPSSVPYLQHAGVDERRITVTGSGTSSRLPALRNRRFGECKKLLFVGKEWERKGGPTLVHAIEQVHAATPHRLTLDVVGCSPAARPYMRVHGVIAPQLMATLFDGADAFTMPTLSEAFGVAFVEALQCGLPVLGSAVGNVPWIIEDGGVCPDPGSGRAVASALVDLIENYGRYSQRAAELAIQRANTWQWPRIAAQIIAHVQAC